MPSLYGVPPIMKKLVGDADHIKENLNSYIHAFSPAVRDIFEAFEFHTQIDRLAKALDADLLMIAPDGRRFAAGNPIADVESPDPSYSEFVDRAPTYDTLLGQIGGFSYGTASQVLGGFQPITAVGLPQPEDTHNAAVGLLDMPSLLHDLLDHGLSRWPKFLGPAHKPLRRELCLPMALRHVLRQGGVSPTGEDPQVGCDTDVPVEDLNGRKRPAYIELLADQRMGNRVVVKIDLDVIVRMNPYRFPLRELIRHLG